MNDPAKYQDLALELGAADAKLLAASEIRLDPRAVLKCRWGCEDYFAQSPKCHVRGTTFQERRDMVGRYVQALIVRSPDARKLSQIVLQVERAAFLDGLYFAFALRYCNLCPACAVDKGKPCPTPEKVRPCDQSFGIDVYRTAREQGLPCQVLQTKEDTPNRYGFVLLD